jgi:hypothetical protein
MKDKSKKVSLVNISLENDKFLCVDVNWKKFYKLDPKQWETLRLEVVPWLFFKYMKDKFNKKNKGISHESVR